MVARDRSGIIPLYMQVKQELLERILRGEYKPNERIPTELELAEEFGVSRITSRRAVQELAKDGIIHRLQGKGSFVKPADTGLIATLSSDADHVEIWRGRKIGMILPSLDSEFILSMLDGAERVARSNGYELVVAHSERSVEEEERLINSLVDSGISGIVLFPTTQQWYNDAILNLKISKFPFALLDRRFRNLRTNFVVSDNRKGAYLATQHLINLAHRDVCLIEPPRRGLSSGEDRFEGYLDALLENDILFDPKTMLISLEREPRGVADGYAVAGILNALKERAKIPSAFFAMNDYLAIAAVRALNELGYSVPEDAAVVGFDNISVAAAEPYSLTTVRQDGILMGAKAMETVIDQIESGDFSSVSEIVLPVELVVRKSCGSQIPLESE